MQIYKNYFGSRLREAIKNANLTQSELAEKMEVLPATVSRWVNGHDFPDDSRLPALIGVLNLPKDYFIVSESKPDTTVEYLLKALSELQKKYEEAINKLRHSDHLLIHLWSKATKTDKELVLRILRKYDTANEIDPASRIKNFGPAKG